ncbi:TPA: glycosyltransferase family 2 protein [Escherichia coli]|uniref:glycosyltransferase family 2 protein n=1 Tax=Escherichia coli TaxID=562 RepID=UPI000DDCAEF8|nr:glycosyltransferase family 2 protein [Escherichia coli]HAJ7594942.1 glycosyltransferase family 2 protein [Escherichia coli]HAJ7604344.1 glycosyltransferase family 2 protein [Escherichia coli]HAV7538923.1 glycosyltransferase family 2 protein [Escherichia coli]
MQDKILLFIPAYNCEKQISRVLNQCLNINEIINEIIVVDNQSTDNTLIAASEEAKNIETPVTIVRNNDNYGLGGSHKVAFQYALDNKFDYIIVLHGDDQGTLSDLLPLITEGKHRDKDCLLGARFMPKSKLEGYSLFRTFGNYVFNNLFSMACGKKLFDLGSGLNMYSVKALASVNYQGFANNLTFNYFMILATVNWKWDIEFFPITWREDDQISNVKLFKQSREVLKILLRYVFMRNKFLTNNYSGREFNSYKFTIMEQHHRRDF